MLSQIYKIIESYSFISLGKNGVTHKDIKKCFQILETGKYIEVYKEYWGYTVHIYGKGFMQGYYPTHVDISEISDLKILKQVLTSAMPLCCG